MGNKVQNYDLSSPSWTTQISTGANSLADGSSVVSAEITRTRDRRRKLSVKLASFTPGTNPRVEVYQLKKLDTGDFEDQNSNNLVALLEVNSGASAKYLFAEDLPNPNVNFKWALKNKCGAGWASSGNTAADLTDGPEIV